MRKLQLLLSIVFLVAAVGFFQNAYSQVVTTSSMYGTVTDDKGEALPGANIIAIHVPSGTQYGTSTRADGKFNITGMRVGGPYKVTVSFVGYNSQSIENLYLELGQNLKVDFKLSESAIQLGDITVVAERDAIIRSDRTGTSTTVRKESIETLPTVSRRIEDLTRLTPQVGRNMTFAGMDNRFNNITIDGSYFNNSFGLAGLPGDRTGVAPISLDAIEQIQVNISPFDVRNGNFVGAGVNTVTKSGTNEYSASVYYNFRNNTFVGKNAGDVEFKSGTFKFGQYGMRLGAPLVQNKLFLFVNFEDDKLTQPGTTYRANLGGEPVGGNITRVLASDLDALSNYLKTNFNYDPGPYQDYDFETPSTRFLMKLDYNIDNKNKVSLRYTHLDSFTDVLLSNSSSLGFGTRRSTTQALNFANSNYKILENIRSIVGEWNSILADNMSNNFIVGYTYNDESREAKGKFFPFVDILQGGSVYTSFGFEPFTPNNELRYKSYQLQNNLSVYLGEHNLTFGISAERYESENVFFPGSQSVYVYNSLADFYTDANGYLADPNRTTSPVTLRRFQVRWSNIPGLEKPVQPLKVWYTGAYAQDQWQILENLNVIAGLRIDVPFFENTGYHNPEVDTMNFKDENGNIVNYRTDKMPDANILFSPRIGFNFDVFGNKMTQLRGGTGIFTGKPAYVWISNQIGNNGILTGFERLDNTTIRPFNPDPNRYKPTNVTGAPAATYELALTDPNFKFPQLWRSNLGIDQKLPFLDLVASVEGLYSRDVNGIYYINANQADPNGALAGADNRPRWTTTAARKIYQKVDNAIVLKNQNEGYYWSVSAALEKPFSDNWYFKAGYNYGEAKNTIDPGSIAFGSWNNNQHAGNPNNPGLGFSANSPGHRVFGTLSYKFDYFNFGSTTITLFGEAYTQGNASYTYAGDLNGDGGTSNDLIYIPKDASEMYFEQYTDGGTTFTVADQQAAWNAFIEQDEYLSKHRGEYAERGAVFMPMVFRADLSVIQEFYGEFIGKKNSLQVRVDILNVTNLLNKNWGVGDNFVTTQPLIFRSIDTEGKPVYRLRSVGGKLIDKTFEPSASIFDVYRIQLGVRYNFN
uniref:TonB-dependent receptor n=2 Tax=Ignavibacterium album TaxID=591197 RepID=A0A7V3E6X8_9BACT